MNAVQVKDKTFRPFISEEDIHKRVAEVGAQLNRDLEGKDPLFLAILNGSFVFAADLMREITIPSQISFIRVSSYSGMESTGKLTEVVGLKENIKGRTVVIVEDIIDSGLTLSWLRTNLQSRGPASVEICTLLRKPTAAKVEIDVKYVGYDIPNEFVVGYGLDYCQKYRNLPYIGILKPDVYAAPAKEA